MAPTKQRDLARRHRHPEWMDDPALDPALHAGALAGLARLHRASGTVGILTRAMRRAGVRPGRETTILDVACGRGDVLARLCRGGARGIGVDVSAEAIRQGRRTHGRGLRFLRRDVLGGDDLPRADVVVCSLFLHHLKGMEARILLERMAAAADRLLLVLDLNRTLANWWMVWAGARVLTRSPVVHVDSALSMDAAFTVREMRAMARGAGLRGARVQARFPALMLLTWQPEQEGADG